MATKFSIADTIANSHGRKSAKVLPQPLLHQTTLPQGTPFGPSTFEKGGSSSRLTLDIRCDDPECLAFFTKLDEWAPQYLAEHSERILGKQMSLEQVRSSYRPCLRAKEGYVPLLHCKITTEGPHATRFWDENKELGKPPADWRDARMIFKVSVPHLWLSGGLCGFVINVLDCQVVDQGAPPPVCPF